MLNSIIKFSLNNKLIVLLGSIMLIIGGIYSTKTMDVDVFPDLTAPTVVIMTDSHGMAPEEVERLVTFPIETSVNGATDVRRVRSSSMHGFSFVWVEFNWGMDIFKARQIVSEKLSTISETLPEGLTPIMAPQSSVMGEIMFIGLQADSTSMSELRTLAEWVIKPAILATGGVSQVTIIGGDYKQYQILADPLKMNLYKIRLDELEQAGRSLSFNSSGGVVRDYGNEYIIRGMARTADLEEIGQTLIKHVNGLPVVISDVADVVIGSAVKQGYASRNAQPAVILSVSKQPNINTLAVTENIEQNLADVQKTLPSDVLMDTKIFRQADFIEASVNNVGKALMEGAVFVILILFLFLGSFRTTFISTLAIPLSLLGSLIIIKLLGYNINTMTLGGMCIAIGSLVDDAIIDVENVYKRLRQNSLLSPKERKPAISVVFEGSSEIRTSIISATFIIIISFTPLFFLSGMEGRMLKPLGIAYIVALFVSLIIAMTVTPLLCHILLSNEKYLDRKKNDRAIIQKWIAKYKQSLDWAYENKIKIICPTLVLLIVSIVMFIMAGRGFLPDFNEGSMTISAVAKPGISLDENNQLGQLAEQALLSIPEVAGTARRTGRGELDEHSQMTNSAEIDVNFKLNDKSKTELFNEVRHKLSEIPGLVTTVGQPLGHRIDHMLSGTQANIAIKLFGTDLGRMFIYGNLIKEAIEDIDGLVDLSIEQQTETPQLQIRADRTMLARYGISIEEFNHFVSTALAGEKIADIYENQRSFDLILRYNQDYTQNIEDIKVALIDTPDGNKVTLETIADIVSTGGPNAISRENVQRKIVISANVSGRDLQSVVDDIQEAIEEEISLPEGYRVEYGGQFESAQNATKTLLLTSIIALLFIFTILYMEFKDFGLSVIVLLNLPLAIIGGVFAIYLSSKIISIPSIIGFITLFGIATRNGILLISEFIRLRNNGISTNQAISIGSADRIIPIIMTALTSALALIPMVINGDHSGNEIQSPMAIVVLGGLLSSTLLNMYVIPVILSWYKNDRKP